MKNTLAVWLCLISLTCGTAAMAKEFNEKRNDSYRDKAKDKSVRDELLAKELAKMAALPAKSAAVLKHADGKSESVDLATKEASKKITAGDTILLEEGVYTTLGGATAPHLRVIGKGRYKTYVNGKGAGPIPVDGTELWDLTLVDARLFARDNEGVFGIGSNFAGEIEIVSAAGRDALSIGAAIVYGFYSIADFKDAPVYSYYSLHAPDPRDTDRRDWESFPLEVTSDYMWYPALVQWKTYKDDYLWRDDPKFYAALLSRLGSTFDDIDAEGFANSPQTKLELRHRITYKRMLAKFGQYVVAQGLGTPIHDVNSVNYANKKLEQALAAKRAGNDLSALALFQEANKWFSFSRNDEIGALARDMARKRREGFGCRITDGAWGAADYVRALDAALKAAHPAAALSLSAPSCHVLITAEKRSKDLGVATKVVGQRDAYEESEASRSRRAWEGERKRDAEAAADRAAARANQARWDGATQAMKNTASKMEYGRLKTENGVTTYGSGDWTGRADPATAAAYDRAKGELRDSRGLAGASGSRPEMVKAGVHETTESTDATAHSRTVIAMIDVRGVRKAIEGNRESSTSKRICREERSANGQFAINTDCRYENDGNNAYETNVKLKFFPAISELYKTRILSTAAKPSPRGESPESVLQSRMHDYLYNGGDAKAVSEAATPFLGSNKRETWSVISSALAF